MDSQLLLYKILFKALFIAILLFFLISNSITTINTARMDSTLKTPFGPLIVLATFVNVVSIIGCTILIIVL